MYFSINRTVGCHVQEDCSKLNLESRWERRENCSTLQNGDWRETADFTWPNSTRFAHLTFFFSTLAIGWPSIPGNFRPWNPCNIAYEHHCISFLYGDVVARQLVYDCCWNYKYITVGYLRVLWMNMMHWRVYFDWYSYVRTIMGKI